MIKTLFTLGLLNAGLFFLVFLGFFNEFFIGIDSELLLEIVSPLIVPSWALALIFPPVLLLVYLLGKHKAYSFSRIEIISLWFNIAIFAFALIGFFLISASVDGMR